MSGDEEQPFRNSQVTHENITQTEQATQEGRERPGTNSQNPIDDHKAKEKCRTTLDTGSVHDGALLSSRSTA